jgi:hypothetical protein
MFGCASKPQPPPLSDTRDSFAATSDLAAFNLSCDACMLATPRNCDAAATATVVAVVSDAVELDDFTRCLRSDDDPNSSQPCFVRRALRFDTASFVRNRDGAHETDSFQTSHQIDLNIPGVSTGVFLRPHATYVVFAARPLNRLDTGADLYVSAACEIASPAER